MSIKKYIYNGPVSEFGKCIHPRWTATTFAVTERKAKSNFEYQFKTQFGKTPNAKIQLTGEVLEAS